MSQSVTTDTMLGARDLFLDLTARDREGIVSLMEHLKVVADQSRDLVVSMSALSAVAAPTAPVSGLAISAPSSFGDLVTPYALRDVAHQQLAELTDIPIRYYRRLLVGNAALWSDNVNYGLSASNADRRFVRITGNEIRALLSPNYLPLDARDLFLTSYRASQDAGSAINRAQLSETRFTLSIVRDEWADNVYTDSRGFTRAIEGRVAPMVSISNSDVGRGGLNVSSGIFSYICTNNCVWMSAVRKRHVSSAAVDGWNFDTETRRLAAQTIWSQVKAAINEALNDRDGFNRRVAAMRDADGKMIAEPQAAIVAIGERYAFSDTEITAVLNEFAAPTRNRGNGGSVLDLVNAITSYAQDVPVDRGTELETVAGQLLSERLPVGVKVRARNGR